MNNTKNKKAFTLAEVLITLAVIGVVAAISIPSLMANQQKQQYLVGLKKAFAITNQAVQTLAADRGCGSDIGCTGIFATGKSNDSIVDELSNYLSITKKCAQGTTGCFTQSFSQNFDGTGAQNTIVYNGISYSKFTTADGMYFALASYGEDCNYASASFSGTSQFSKICAFLIVDTNGEKKPNMSGRDIHSFYISNSPGANIIPVGGFDDQDFCPWNGYSSCNGTVDASPSDWACDPQGNKDGSYCAARIISEGWQMNY